MSHSETLLRSIVLSIRKSMLEVAVPVTVNCALQLAFVPLLIPEHCRDRVGGGQYDPDVQYAEYV